MRTLPPTQTSKFLQGWDRILREGFEKLINSSVDDKWWAVVQLNSKYGGMGLKSGIHTSGAQHLASLVNSADGIRRFIPEWKLYDIAKESTEQWLQEQLAAPINVNLLVDSLFRRGFWQKN